MFIISVISSSDWFRRFLFQSGVHESWMLEDGIVKDGSYNIEQGVGVRAISGEKNRVALNICVL